MTMSRRTALWIAWIAGVLLVVLHLDYWRADEGALLLGWLPGELAYRLVYVGLAWAYILFLCRFVWREPDS